MLNDHDNIHKSNDKTKIKTKRQCMPSIISMFKHKEDSSSSTNEQLPTVITASSEIQSKTIRRASELHFFQGGVPKRYEDTLKWIGRLGFIAKGVVYGCIGVLTLTNLTGAWTPNGSAGNESPQVNEEGLIFLFCKS